MTIAKPMRFSTAILFAIVALGWSYPPARAGEPEPNKGGPPEFKFLKFRLIGPAVGGRVARASGVPGDPLTYYAASASGGVWKSTDGGAQWKPIFDDQPIASIGSIAVAPSDPNVIYVGSGEANTRGNVAPGNGIYKSTDAGKTWKHVWNQEGQIGTMVVHPKNADIAYAAVLGHAFGPNPERGAYRTTDGGRTWNKVLYKDPDTGASDVCLDPSNPRILFAGLWQARRRPWEFTSGGPGSGLYMSRDGGDTWMQLLAKEGPQPPGTYGKGLPEGIWGKIGVAVAPSDGRRVYALIEAEGDKGGLYRSDDGGESWSLASSGHYLRQRAWYYSTLTIDPKNPDVVWCPQVPMLRSIDGGKTFKRVKGMHHGDNHDLWIDPANPKRMIGSNDGGVDISVDGGETWFAPPLPIAQFYHIAVDNDMPYHVSGAMQDLGTAEGPSNSLAAGGISNCHWRDVGGGEAGHTAHDPTNPDIVYAGEYGGIITRFDNRTGQVRNVSIYPYNPSGHGGEDLRYRFQWTAPILVSPHDPHVIYHAANVLFQTTDAGGHWSAISPDLTRNDKSKQKWSGGPITGDNTGVEIYGTIFAFAESPKDKQVLWAGSDDGLVHLSRDGGKHWTNLTANIHGLPEWATVDCIEASPFDAATAYLVGDAHRIDDMRPHLYKTSDFGQTWESLGERLPQDIYLHAVREDPKRKGMLYVGTERGIAYSTDDGGSWQHLKLNFPTVAVHDLQIKNNDLVLGTHGRSVWILDDLTPLREFSPQLADAGPHLFGVDSPTLWHYRNPFFGKPVGENPPPGAIIDYFLKDKPKGKITLEIRDDKGHLVDTFASKPPKKRPSSGIKREKVESTPSGARAETPAAAKPDEEEKEEIPEDDPDAPDEHERVKKLVLSAEPGVNRVTWDLRYKGADKIKGAKIDMGNTEPGPLVLTGKYTLKLTVEGKSYSTSVTVRPDPRINVPAADLDDGLRLTLQIRDDLDQLVGMVNQVRSIKKQLQTREELLKGNPETQSLLKPGQELQARLTALEEKLHNPHAEVAYDILAQRGGAKLYSQYTALFEFVKDSDGAPTEGMREVYAEHKSELNRLAAEYQELLGGPLQKINELARKLSVPNIIVTRPKSTKNREGDTARP
jgi:photosystem II stability/assembly factor-like uncharacterized protein